jgi:hypothetical protein
VTEAKTNLPVIYRPRREATTRTWREKSIQKSNETYNTSSSEPPLPTTSFASNRMSFKQAMSQTHRQNEVIKALKDEIKNMESFEVMKLIQFKDIPAQHRKLIVPVFMFFKDKYKADGFFDKTKARIVTNRQKRDYSLIGETSSKTVNPITVMTLVHLPLMYEEYEMNAHDIKGAFPLARVPSEVEIYAKVPKEIVLHWKIMYPHVNKFTNNDGSEC